jgi:pyruvate dehydrogenase E2 component (dihydrolipoamide acetyltransferase)
MDVDLSRVTGSGPGGRIRKPDLATPAPVAGGEKRVAYRGMRKRIGDHLVHAKQTAPHFTYVEEADLTALVQLKADLEPVAQQKNIKLTYLPFIMKAVIEGLRQFPQLNSSLDETAQEIVLKYDYNIGVAMATAEGLIVPVVHQVQHKSLFEIASEISQLSEKARQNKLTLPELQGGTFTLTSIGSIGGIFSAPIINYPEVAIIGIQKIEKRPVVRNDEIVIREMTYFSISCDHRVVDGAEAAMFMKTVIEALEHPGRLLVA